MSNVPSSLIDVMLSLIEKKYNLITRYGSSTRYKELDNEISSVLGLIKQEINLKYKNYDKCSQEENNISKLDEQQIDLKEIKKMLNNLIDLTSC